MVSQIVLTRHGKACSPTEGQDDFARPLSQAGARALASTLPSTLAFALRGNPRIAVASSPAARAVQTALLLRDALESCGADVEADVELVDALWEQDAPEALGAIRDIDADTVFAVGHNPFMEDWAFALAGAQLPFATGAMACVRLADDAAGGHTVTGGAHAASHGNCRLLWFAQGPQSQRWKTLVALEGSLANAAERVEERREAFFEDPDDAETMHKLRVSLRTLRSLVAFIAPWQSRRQNKELQSDLKSVVAHTSRLRELDVFGEQMRLSAAGTAETLAFCDELAAAERQRVAAKLASPKTERTLARALQAARGIRWKRPVELEGLDASDVRARFDQVTARLEGDLAALDIADAEATHDVRKAAKRVRYAAECFKQVLGADAPDIARAMTAHQDDLGALCDARVNIDLVNSLLERDLPNAIAWDLSLMRARSETYLYATLKSR